MYYFVSFKDIHLMIISIQKSMKNPIHGREEYFILRNFYLEHYNEHNLHQIYLGHMHA